MLSRHAPMLRAILVAVFFSLAAVVSTGWARNDIAHPAALPTSPVAELPPEARVTIAAIRREGPFTGPRDGVVFSNFERALPLRERGYYREYTVPTPGLTHRGARRIVAGRGGELYYTDDHYRSFRRIRE